MTTQIQVLYSIMQDGSEVTPETLLSTMNVSKGTLMCLLSALRNKFKADIVTRKDGRTVLTYRLTNAQKLTVLQPKVRKAPAPKKASVGVSGDPSEDDDMHTGISDREFADLRHQLGF